MSRVMTLPMTRFSMSSIAKPPVMSLKASLKPALSFCKTMTAAGDECKWVFDGALQSTTRVFWQSTVTRCYLVARSACRMLQVTTSLRLTFRRSASPLILQPYVRDLHSYRRPSSGRAGLAWQSRDARDCRARVHWHRRATGRRVAQALCHRSDLPIALCFVPARRSRHAAGIFAAARPGACRDRLDRACGALDIRGYLAPDRRRSAFAGSLSRLDAAGRGLSHDGRAGACGRDGARFNARAGHARDRHRSCPRHRAAVRLHFSRLGADALPVRAWAEAARDPCRVSVCRRRHPLEHWQRRDQAACPTDRREDG